MAVARAHAPRLARLWIVAPCGIRPDAAKLAREPGVLTPGLRQLERFDRLAAASFDVRGLDSSTLGP